MFENIKSFLYKIAFVILFFVLAKSCVSDYVNGADENRIAELEQMINDKTTVTANLSSEYTVTTIAKLVKLYKFDYSFELNGQSHSGKIILNEIPNTNKLNIYYLNGDPSIVSADPYESLKSEKEKGNSISDLLVGLVWGILALLFLMSLISDFKKKEKLETVDSKSIKRNEKRKLEIKEKPIETVEEISEEEKQKQEIEKERIRKEKEDPTRFMPK